MRFRTRFGLGLGMAMAGAAMGLVGAFACTSLAALNLSAASGPAGSQITVSGSSFNAVADGNTPVAIHFNGATGPVLATEAPDGSGGLAPIAITIPSNLKPGVYSIIASQTDKGGLPSFGTPARAAFEVTAPGTGPQGQAVGGPGVTVTPSGSGLGAGTIGLLVALGVGGLLLFGMGAATFVSGARRVPAASKVRKP